MNIITGKLEPDEGKVEWAKRIRIGYLDQHAQLKQGMTIRDVLKTAFQYLFDMETEMNELFGKMGTHPLKSWRTFLKRQVPCKKH